MNLQENQKHLENNKCYSDYEIPSSNNTRDLPNNGINLFKYQQFNPEDYTSDGYSKRIDKDVL